ncbi:MAG: hypothetical protein IT480_11285 [Gammaproteobacteria bacterium]|nr:hypothetical protein [Gammaproteobacteria bacterium]
MALQARLAGMVQALQHSSLAGLAAVDDLLAQLGTAAAGGRDGNGAALAAQATLRERTTLHVVTQQGDLVEIELRARAELGMAAAASASSDAAAATAAVRVVSGSSLEVRVRGDLNEKELAAIGEVLGEVEALAAQFHSGDVAAAFAAAGALRIDGGQLASVAMEMRQSLRLQAAAAAVSAGPSAVAAGATRTAEPVSATAGAYLAGAVERLEAAGTALAQLGMRHKLQLLLRAAQQVAPPADAATGKLAESVQALG